MKIHDCKQGEHDAIDAAVVDAGREALVALAALKITDTEKPYAEISPALRQQMLKAHDLLVAALAAERETGQQLIKLHREAVDKCNELREQLAAERERCDEIWRIGKAELSAERKRYVRVMDSAMSGLEKKLAAAREKVRELECELKELS